MLKDILALRGLRAKSGGDTSWVVCGETEPSIVTTINELRELRLRLPNADIIIPYAFNGCNSIVSVDMPVATLIYEFAFHGCTNLTFVNLPVATDIYPNAFSDCYSLTSVDLPNANSIGNYAFEGCTRLSALILRNTETVCRLHVTAVMGTKIVTLEGAPTGEGFIYVPSALYETYVEWIAMQAAQLVGDAATAEYIARAVLRKIEDYPEICG